MGKLLIIGFLFVFISSGIPTNTVKNFTVESTFSKDSSVILFGDSSYKLTLHIFDKDNYDETKKNAVLVFSKKEKKGLKIIFRDSLYCMYSDIRFQDFNNDKIKDILIFYYTGARANPTYHLYLIDSKNKKLIRVKRFEELPNPDLDETNNIITSMAQAGLNYYSFYRIKNNKLKNLGHSFEADLSDSVKYDKAIRKILIEHK